MDEKREQYLLWKGVATVTMEPLTDHLVVRLLDTPSTSASGIEVVRFHKPPQTHAIVEATGPEVRDVQVGQRVLISRLQGVAVGDGRLILPEGAVLATLEEGE